MKRLVMVGLIMGIGLVLMWTSSGLSQQKLAPYPIGFCADLTGRMSEMGTANKRGMEIAIEGINAAGSGDFLSKCSKVRK
jgi:ABC-type branched-subunit amino acid transport system substrate-binding protein